ncbi:MAG: DUF4430 domain-containing protein [Eubacteriales bacterium]|nr:DUF4430 domain-containing protein [Eubacteriales bacterium]
MNYKKILLFSLVMIFTLGVFSSCVTDSTQISVNLIIRAGDDRIFSSEVKVNTENPTVIDAVREAIATYELDITLDSNGNSISKVKNYYDTEIEGITYYWMYTINGVEPTTGKASSNVIADGDKIEYIFYSSDPGDDPPATMKSVPYKSEWELFGEHDDEETTEEVAAEETEA